jgi:hypothetical protein
MNNKSLIEDIYDTDEDGLHNLAQHAIQQVCDQLKKNACEIINRTDISSNRWILINLLNVLYKDVFLLQTKDFKEIITTTPHVEKKNEFDRCVTCDKKLTESKILEQLSDDERMKGLCLNCLISTVEQGEWFDESWGTLINTIPKIKNVD